MLRLQWIIRKGTPGRVFFGAALFLMLCLPVWVAGANRYSVATGSWGSASTWSATSGGASGASVPVAGDNAFIEGGFTVTVNSNSACTNATVASGSNLTIGGNNFTVSGTTTVSGTIVHSSNNGTKSHGNVIMSGGTWTSNAAETYAINSMTLSGSTFNGSSTGIFNVGTTLSVSSATTNTFYASTLTVTGTSTVTGTLYFANATGTKTFIGLVTINPAGVWDNSGNSVVVMNAGLTYNGAGFISGTGTYSFVGGNQTISGTLSVANVIVTGITLTNTGILTIGTSLSGNGGLTQGTNDILNLGGTVTINTLTATASGNTVNYNGTAQTCKPATYLNLTVSNTGVKTFTTTPTVNGILSCEDAATIVVTSGVVTYGTGATLIYNSATARNATSEEWITPFMATGGVIITNTGAVTMNEAKVLGTAVPITIDAGATLVSGNFQISFGGNFIDNGGTFSAGSSPLDITGAMATQSIAGFSTAGLVTMTKTSGTATFQDNTIGGALTVNGSGGMLNLGTDLNHNFTGAVTVTAGTLNGGSLTTVGVSGNWVKNNGTFTAGSGTVVLGGTSAQSIGGSSATTFNNLTINNNAGVTLSANSTLSGILNLSGGIVSTGSNLITVTNSSTGAVSGGSPTNFINGSLTWTLTSGQNYSFPVGVGVTFLPFGLSGVSGTNPQVRVQAFSGPTGGSVASPLTLLSNAEYWLASVISGTYSGGVVSLTRQAALNEFESIGRSSGLTGVYASLHGVVSGTSIINSDNTGASLAYFVMASTRSVTTGTITPNAYCPGASVSVPYTITGSFSPGNIFTAQISDATGSFATPTAIGSVTSQVSGTIAATIPSNQPLGSAYRFRVVSSAPSVTGSDNGANVTIIRPTITGISAGSRCGSGTVILGATASAGIINWYSTLIGGTSLGTGTTFTTPSISNSTTYYVDATLGACISTPRTAVLASIITPPTITAGGGGTFCSGATVNLTSSGTNISNRYWQGPNNFYSLEQNPVLTNVTTAMSGTYTVTGSALSGINLVNNGDFELGNTGFTSEYVPGQPTPTGLVPEGTFDVIANPQSRHASFATCGDHTTGSGLQMVINGAVTAGVSVWAQTVNVIPGTDYQYSYWVQSVVAGNPSQLQLYINGIAAGPVYTALTPTCQWIQFIYNWNSGVSSTAYLSLENQNTIANGNDFALDDIIFQPVCAAVTGKSPYSMTDAPVSASVDVVVNAVVTAGSIGTAQSICRGSTPAMLTSVTPGTGSGVISYEWQTNASGSYVPIAGATAATYSPPALNATTSYQRRTVAVSGGATCYSSSNTAAVTIAVSGPTVVSGGPNIVCQSASPAAITLTGASVGGGASTAAWSIISGGGTLSSTAQTANPAAITYTPAINYSGVAILRITTNTVSGCAAISERTINITSAPAVAAGTAVITCSSAGAVNVTAGATALNYAGLNWTSSGTGTFTNASSLTAATYTPSPADISAGSVILTLTATGNNPCGNAIATKILTITTLPAATITYAGNPFCKSLATAQPVTATGTTGGTYTASPAGLTINASTGAITPGTSTEGTYTVTYTISATGGCGVVTATTSVTITAVPTATVSYAGTPFCTSLITAQPVILSGTGAYTGGVFSSTAGLSLNSSTGAITPGSSTAGTYTVTYTIPSAGGCPAVPVTTSVTITSLPVATFSYTGSPYCSNASNPSPAFSGGGVAGTFSSTAGLVFVNTTTGQVNIPASTAGTYTVTNTIAASGGCAQVTSTSSITITTLPAATISYSGTPFCKSLATAQPVTRTGTAGGTYTASPAGLTINASTGAITPGTSTAGTYTVTYSISATGGCGVVTATTSVTITALPVATFSYPGSPYCSNAPDPLPVFSGGGVAGVFSSSPGLVFTNTSTGQVDLTASTPGTYLVTNRIVSAGGCAEVVETFNITIDENPVASIFYPGTPFCQTVSSPQPVVLTGTAGGAYTSTPAGLFINPVSGEITPGASLPGTYLVSYTIAPSGGCSSVIANTSVTINPLPVATFTYTGSPFCKNAQNPLPAYSGGGVAGIFSSTPGLVFVSSSTGEIDIVASATGTYPVTNTISASGGCEEVSFTSIVTINPDTPATPGLISGSNGQCPYLTDQVYSVSPVSNASEYTWSVPTGWTITSGAGTPSITVTTGGPGMNGEISVSASNACGTSAASTITVSVYQIEVIASLGIVDACYPTIKAAFDKINDGTHRGEIIIKIHGNTTETATAVLNGSGIGNSNYNSVLVYPTGIFAVSGNFPGDLIDLNGTSHLTIDGRVNLTGTDIGLTLVETDISSANSRTIRFVNSAENNMIRFCTIAGSCTSTSAGVIFFSSSTAGIGNDDNTIEFCNITNAGGNRPISAVYSNGSAGFVNNGNILRNNHIYNCFQPAAPSCGISLTAYSSDWIITGNSFYETTSWIATGTNTYRAIYISNTSGNNFSIINNHIGGSSFECGGGPWTMSGGATTFYGIELNVGAVTASSIQGNVIRNFNFTSTGNAPWQGIRLTGGALNVGTETGNEIGASEGTGSVLLTNSTVTATSYGIYCSSPAAVSIVNNSIGSITTIGSTSIAHNFTGILNSGAGVKIISTNTIGSTLTARSVQTSSVVTGTSLQNLIAISNSGSGTITISGNTVANLYNAFSRATTSGQVAGILTTQGVNTITNNIIRGLSTPSGSTGITNITASVVGIALTGTLAGQTVSGNAIYDLSNTYNASRAITIYGLYLSNGTAAGAHTISGNFIHSLTLAAANTSTSASINGIRIIHTATGANIVTSTYFNNIISLGAGVTNGCIIQGIYETGYTSGTSNNRNLFYFNTVYIGGTPSANTLTYAFFNNQSGGNTLRTLKNNLFYNARSSSSGTNYHFAIRLASITGVAIDFNDYYANGTGGAIGRLNTTNYTTLSTWKTALISIAGDVNSLDIDPYLTNAGGTLATDYKININLIGVSIPGITTDFGGDSRGTTPSMGAWEKMLRKWKGSISTNFATGGNWTDGTVPSSGENIIFEDDPDRDCFLDGDRIIGSLTINQVIDKMVLNGYRLSVNGDLFLTNNGQIDASSAGSTIALTGISLQTIGTGTFAGNNVYNFMVSNSAGVSLNGDLDIIGALDLSAGSLALGSGTLGINGSIVRIDGSVTAGVSSTVKIGGSDAQLGIPGGTFTTNSVNNFTIARAAGVFLNNDLNVGGILDLQAANPSSTTGLLETGINSLMMGLSATTVGQGDVNGTVTRSSFLPGIPYTFGNEFTTMTFASGGTLPAAIGVKISLGVTPAWKQDAIQRTYDIVHDGGSSTGVALSLHYLDSELNGNAEADVYPWDYHAITNPIRLEKHARSGQSTVNKWISTSLSDVGYFGTGYNEHPWTLARSVYVTFMGVKGWRMITSPTLTTSADLLTGFITQGVPGSTFPEKQPNFLWFDETDTLTTNMSWRTSVYNDNLTQGRGYYFYVFDSVSGTSSDTLPRRMTSSGNAYFPGSFSYSGLNQPVTYTPRAGGQTSQSPTDTVFYDTNIDDQGWNLMGNPTISTLDWDEAAGWTKTNLDNTIYIWDPATNQFRVWNGVNGTLGNGLISPFQAFWIKANNPSPALSFTSAALSSGGTFYGGTAVKSKPVAFAPEAINLSLTSSGLESEILVSFKEDGKAGPDVWDAYRLEPLSDSWMEFFTLSSPAHTMPLVINNLPSDGPDCINLPLFTGGQVQGQQLGGTYTISWELPQDWPSDWAISLNDHSEKRAISMKREHTYSFTSSVTKSTGSIPVNRVVDEVPVLPPSVINPVAVGSRLKSATELPPFSIVIEKGKSGDDPTYLAPEPSLLQNYPNPFSQNTTIRFSLPEPAHVSLKIYTIHGQLIDVVADGDFETGIHNFPWSNNYTKPGFYMLQMDAGAIKKTNKMVITN